MKSWLIGLTKKKAASKVISSVKPNVPKTDIEKATRTLKVEAQRMKASMAKMGSDVFHGTQKLKKSIEKMKTPKKTKHYYKD